MVAALAQRLLPAAAILTSLGLGCRDRRDERAPLPSAVARASADTTALARSAAPSASAPAPVPRDLGPLQELRAFVRAAPDHPRAAALSRVHDRRYLPCPGGPEGCQSDASLVLEGLLARARHFSKECLACEGKPRVRALAARLRGELLKARTAETQARFLRWVELDVEAAEQVLAEVDRVETGAAKALTAELERRRAARGEAAGIDLGCRVGPEASIVVAPTPAREGAPVRALITWDSPPVDPTFTLERRERDGRLAHAGGARLLAVTLGPPAYARIELPPLPTGSYRLKVSSAERGPKLCRRFSVVAADPVKKSAGAWTSIDSFERSGERLWSAWVAALLHELDSAGRPASALLADAARNPLLTPGDPPAQLLDGLAMNDAIDLGHVLRAYFARALRLPFGWERRPATSGTGAALFTSNELFTATREVGAGAHTRGLLEALVADVDPGALAGPPEQPSQLYPLALETTALRPGVLVVSTGGGAALLAGRRAGSPGAPGPWLAARVEHGRVTVAPLDAGALAGAGTLRLLAFTPLVLRPGGARALARWEIEVADGYADSTSEQLELGRDALVNRLEALLR